MAGWVCFAAGDGTATRVSPSRHEHGRPSPRGTTAGRRVGRIDFTRSSQARQEGFCPLDKDLSWMSANRKQSSDSIGSGQVVNPLLYLYCVRLSEINPTPKLGVRLTAPIPIQPRNSTVQCFLLYRFNISMLPFAMRSTPIPAGVAGGASSVLLATRAPLLSGRTSVPTLVVDRFAHPLFSYCYELLFPQLLCFDNHLRCPIVFLALPPSPAPSANSVVNTPLTPLLTYCCELLFVAKRVNSFAIKEIQTLFAKYPGVGVPRRQPSAHPQALLAPAPRRNVDTARTSNYHCCNVWDPGPWMKLPN